MRIVGYKQPQTVVAQKTEKPAADGKDDGNKPNGNKPNGNKPNVNKTQDDNKPAADGKK